MLAPHVLIILSFTLIVRGITVYITTVGLNCRTLYTDNSKMYSAYISSEIVDVRIKECSRHSLCNLCANMPPQDNFTTRLFWLFFISSYFVFLARVSLVGTHLYYFLDQNLTILCTLF